MSARERDTLYFDGKCGMCQRTTRWLRRLDWLGRLAFEDSTEIPEEALPVSRERSLEGIPMRTRDGRALVGFPAVRRAMAQTPLGALPALLFYLPGLSALGAWVYGKIAANRARATCAVNLEQGAGKTSAQSSS